MSAYFIRTNFCKNFKFHLRLEPSVKSLKKLPTFYHEIIKYWENIAILSQFLTRRCSVKKGVLSNFAKFTGKHLCQSLYFNKVAALLKKKLWHRCFPVNFAKFLRTRFLQNTSRRLLLQIYEKPASQLYYEGYFSTTLIST